jgi:hypothetical protein
MRNVVSPAQAGSKGNVVIPAQAGSKGNVVIPAQAGIQSSRGLLLKALDSRLRGNDAAEELAC